MRWHCWLCNEYMGILSDAEKRHTESLFGEYTFSLVKE
jgi:hypothetical protein